MAPHRSRLLHATGLSLALLFGFLLSGTTLALAASPPADTAHTLCKGDSLRTGEVIMQQWTNWFQCSGGLWNQNNVQLVAPTTLSSAPSEVCINSPVPDGFVIIHQSRSNDLCHSESMTIQLLALPTSSPVVICGNSPIPIGWITVAELGGAPSDPHQVDCPLESQMSIGTKAIQLPPNAVSAVCADSYVPSDFQVDSYTTPNPHCLQDQGNSMLIEPSYGLSVPDPTV